MDPLPTMKLTRAETPHGVNLNVNYPDERHTGYFAAIQLMQNDKLGATYRAFDTLLASSAIELVQRNESGYHGAALDTEKQTFFLRVKPYLKKSIAQTRELRSDHAARIARTTEFDRAAEPNASLRSDVRNWLLNHTETERIALLLRADYTLAVSAIEVGPVILGIPEDVWNEFLDHARAIIHVYKAGLDAGFALQPSEKFISAAGPDHNAALNAAHRQVKELHDETDLLQIAEDYLQAVVRFISMLSDKSVDELLS